MSKCNFCGMELTSTHQLHDIYHCAEFLKHRLEDVEKLEAELARLREAARWIPVDSEPAPEDIDNYGSLVDSKGACFWVRNPEVK